MCWVVWGVGKQLQVMVGVVETDGTDGAIDRSDGSNVPPSTFPCVVERRVGFATGVVGPDHLRDVHVVGVDGGEEEGVEVSFPVDFRGWVSDWDDLEAVYRHAFSSLPPPFPSLPSPLCSVIIPVPFILSPMRSKIETLMLKTFGFARVATHPRPLLALYNHGCMSGVVIDMGEVRTVITPVIKGMVVSAARKTVPVNGRDITRRLHRLISHPEVDLRVAKDIRDTRCFVSHHDSDQPAEEDSAGASAGVDDEYVLPGLDGEPGEILSLGSWLHEAPECLFSPPLIGYDAYGLAEALVASIDESVRHHTEGGDVRKMMYKRIVVVGTTANLPNLSARLESEIRRIHKPRPTPTVSKIRIRRSSVFQGAALLGEIMRASTGTDDDDDDPFWTTC